ncbi:hypothetical protein F2Q69_00013577 [Brassica cretica]|uniref:Aspartic peptidase DDI1-type domain-containing protein n=2 Tax=Brassica cretica TaxID=69181 RepID=A0A8S9QY98_BRACR|nr:hypothetical protein F2Q69_00013577 [Brassica cretica]
MQVDQATVGRTLRNRKEKVPKHLKRGANDKEMECFRKRILRIPLDKPFEEAYFTHKLWMFFKETKKTEEDIRRMFNQVREKMKQRNTLKKRITLKKKSDPEKFVVPCFIRGIDYPSALCDTGSSVSILPKVMADHLGLKIEPSEDSFTFVDCSQKNSGGFIRNLEVQIGNALVPVDFHVLDIKLNWNSSLLLGSIHGYLRVVKQQIGYMEIGDNPGFIAVCHCDHEADEQSEAETSIATQPKISIDEKLVLMIDNELEEPIDSDHTNEIDDFQEGSLNSWENDCYQPSFTVHTVIPSKRKMSAMEPYEYDEDYREEEIIEYRGLSMEEAGVLQISHETIRETSIDGNNKISIDTHHGIEPDARTEDSTSIDRKGQPLIDVLIEFGKRAYDSDGKRLFEWEKKDEYNLYTDEHVYARAPDGRIIHHAEKFTRILPRLRSYRLRSYSKEDMDDIVHVISRAQEMSLDDTYKRLEDVYYSLNDSIDRLTTRMDELKQEMDMIRRQNAIRSEASLDGLTRPSIDGGYEYLKKRLVTVKLLEDKLDEINFSQDLMREDFSQRLEDLDETTQARLGMHQHIINNF